MSDTKIEQGKEENKQPTQYGPDTVLPAKPIDIRKAAGQEFQAETGFTAEQIEKAVEAEKNKPSGGGVK